MHKSHYYDRTIGSVIKRPEKNPVKERGRKSGYKQRQKDQDKRVYPREGLPISRIDREQDWIDGYQLAYYQDAAAVGRPAWGEAQRVQTSVTLDRALLETADLAGINRSQACDLGLALLTQDFEDRLADAWADKISGIIENNEGLTVISGDSEYTANSLLEAILLMLCDRPNLP